MLITRNQLFNQFIRELDRESETIDVDFTILNGKDCKRIYLDLPGVKKEDITVSVDSMLLKIEAERKDFVKKKYTKTLRLGSDVDYMRADVSLTDGVLTIELPLSERNKPKTLSIK